MNEICVMDMIFQRHEDRVLNIAYFFICMMSKQIMNKKCIKIIAHILICCMYLTDNMPSTSFPKNDRTTFLLLQNGKLDYERVLTFLLAWA